MPSLIAAAKSPALRTSLLLGAVPLGLGMVSAGLVEMDKLVAGRRRQLERLEAAIRAAQAQLDGLVDVPGVSGWLLDEPGSADPAAATA